MIDQYEAGTRVVAIMDANAEDKTVRIFGYGVYQGRKMLPPDHYMLGGNEEQYRQAIEKEFLGKEREGIEKLFDRSKMDPEQQAEFDKKFAEEQKLREEGKFSYTEEDVETMLKTARSNPYIELDNGQGVWGAECWWGPEEEFKKRYEGWDIVEVDIEQEREEARQRAHAASSE
tara:strand:+ start:83987 stop:84508 length:522 start_codon:yes stop_codon:yes gene_type:complete